MWERRLASLAIAVAVVQASPVLAQKRSAAPPPHSARCSSTCPVANITVDADDLDSASGPIDGSAAKCFRHTADVHHLVSASGPTDASVAKYFCRGPHATLWHPASGRPVDTHPP